jgi:glycosyltransferase involved in cell wall biosynthesis
VSRQRVVRIVGNNGGGGARIHCFQLNRALEAAGVATTTFIPAPPRSDPFTSADHVGMDYRHEIGLAAMIRALWPVRRQIAFVHSHLMRATLRGALLARLFGVPHVVTLHSPLWEGRPSRRDRLARIAWRRAVGGADLVIAISRYIQDTAISQLGDPPLRRIAVVYNGSDDLAEPGAVKGSEPTLRIAIVGELTDRKGMADLLELVGRVERGPAADRVRFHVYGDGPWRDRLAAASGRTLFVEGYRGDVRDIYSCSDLHLILSRTEAFGRVVSEAMAFSVPTVAYRSGAFPELIENEADGMLANSFEALLDIVERLALNPERVRALGAAARRTFEARFTVERFAESTIAALRSANLIPPQGGAGPARS